MITKKLLSVVLFLGLLLSCNSLGNKNKFSKNPIKDQNFVSENGWSGGAGNSSNKRSLAATSFRYPLHVVSWVKNNIYNIETLEEEKKKPIYHMVYAFYSRLANWRRYKPFYDRLFQDPGNAKKYIYFVDASKGLYIFILQSSQKLTDLPPYQSLRGKTSKEVFGYVGGWNMLMDDQSTEATRQTLIIRKRKISTCVTGDYNYFYHEFAHLLHFTLLSEEEFRYLEELYESAMKENRYLDDYSSKHIAEYFAQGLEAYFSVFKLFRVAMIGTEYKHTREDLEKKDPKLLIFIESLIDNKQSLKVFETVTTCDLSYHNRKP